jgi:hypothetical protein
MMADGGALSPRLMNSVERSPHLTGNGIAIGRAMMDVLVWHVDQHQSSKNTARTAKF